MSDGKQRKTGPASGSALASRVNAPPFVPGQGSQGRGSMPAVNARPFVPAARISNSTSSGSLGLDSLKARPFIPGSSGIQAASAVSKGTSPNAAPFVPAAVPGNSAKGQATMSTAAPAFVPKAVPEPPQGSRDIRPAQRPDPRLPEGDDLLGMTAHTPLVDGRGPPNTTGHVMPGLNNVPARPAAPYGGGAGRAPRGRSLPASFVPGPGRGRFGPAGYDGGGRGRGRRPPMQGGPGYGGHQSGNYSGDYSALGRSQHAANAMAESLLPQLQSQAYVVYAQMTPEMQAEARLPDMVQQYHTLYPLEDLAGAEAGSSKTFGAQTTVLKGISMHDGQAYVLRRVGWRQVHPTPDLHRHADEVVEAWSAVAAHPGLLAPRAVFVSAEMGGQPSLFTVHDYHPSAMTLEAAHLQPQTTSAGLVQVAVAENTLWSYLTQLTAALRAVHSVGLACRSAMHPSKVLLTTAGRLRIGSLGVAEIIAGKAGRQEDVGTLQREDLQALGRLMLLLACASPHPSLEYCAQHFSQDITRSIASLLGHQDPITSWCQLDGMLGDQALVELDTQHQTLDAVVTQLAKEAGNGRLMRLLVRLCMIVERPDLGAEWSETGDRYLLKLFQDYVFHQSGEDGGPILEWGHVVECLNKLDAGVPEKVLLLSRDESSMLVVSYADLKRCVESTFSDLRSQATAARSRARLERPRTPL